MGWRAPQLQPDVTEAETTAAQAIHMRRTTETRQAVTAAPADPLPELHPWREVGWIFRDGGCIAIERECTEIHSQVPVD